MENVLKSDLKRQCVKGLDTNYNYFVYFQSKIYLN